MAEVERLTSQASDATGVFQMFVTIEDTQTTLDPRGRVSPTVVAIRVVNTSARRGSVTWQAPNGIWTTMEVLIGENQENRISPPRREFFHLWSESANADWGL